jgi:hypothetical protein
MNILIKTALVIIIFNDAVSTANSFLQLGSLCVYFLQNTCEYLWFLPPLRAGKRTSFASCCCMLFILVFAPVDLRHCDWQGQRGMKADWTLSPSCPVSWQLRYVWIQMNVLTSLYSIPRYTSNRFKSFRLYEMHKLIPVFQFTSKFSLIRAPSSRKPIVVPVGK